MKIKRTNQGKFGLRWQPAEAKRSEDWSEAATPLFARFLHVQKRRGVSLPAAVQIFWLRLGPRPDFAKA